MHTSTNADWCTGAFTQHICTPTYRYLYMYTCMSVHACIDVRRISYIYVRIYIYVSRCMYLYCMGDEAMYLYEMPATCWASFGKVRVGLKWVWQSSRILWKGFGTFAASRVAAGRRKPRGSSSAMATLRRELALQGSEQAACMLMQWCCAGPCMKLAQAGVQGSHLAS